jgi:hypothetical protein
MSPLSTLKRSTSASWPTGWGSALSPIRISRASCPPSAGTRCLAGAGPLNDGPPSGLPWVPCPLKCTTRGRCLRSNFWRSPGPHGPRGDQLKRVAILGRLDLVGDRPDLFIESQGTRLEGVGRQEQDLGLGHRNGPSPSLRPWAIGSRHRSRLDVRGRDCSDVRPGRRSHHAMPPGSRQAAAGAYLDGRW